MCPTLPPQPSATRLCVGGTLLPNLATRSSQIWQREQCATADSTHPFPIPSPAAGCRHAPPADIPLRFGDALMELDHAVGEIMTGLRAAQAEIGRKPNLMFSMRCVEGGSDATPHTNHTPTTHLPHTYHTPHTSHLTPHTSHHTPHTTHRTPHTAHRTSLHRTSLHRTSLHRIRYTAYFTPYTAHGRLRTIPSSSSRLTTDHG